MPEVLPEVLIEEARDHVALVRIHRPKVKNALNMRVREQLAEHFTRLGGDEKVRCIVLTGNEEAFAAGADIGEMAEAGPMDMLRTNRIAQWDRVRRISKPVIAAVAGWCLGGGCELAMTLDIVIAAESAKFGQPEIKIGIMPGAGGTQRLPRAVGKSKAMEMILTGEPISAAEAERIGLVSRVVPNEVLETDALDLAAEIAKRAPLALRLAKESVNAAYEMSLTDGLAHERRLFYLLFSSEDQKEGMAAFLEKREPDFTGR
jgi:enoyl-CoA hydratase